MSFSDVLETPNEKKKKNNFSAIEIGRATLFSPIR